MNAKNQSPSLLQQKSTALEAARASDGADATVPAESLPEIGESTTGVVFVHGIGEQVRAEILLGWSRPIVQAVADWASSLEVKSEGSVPSSGDRVVRSGIDFEGSDLPLVTVGVPGTTIDGTEYAPQTWVMTEARWAQDVQPPSLETMIDWCGPRGVVATVVNRIVEQSIAGERIEQGGANSSSTPRQVGKDAARVLAEMGLSAFVSVVVTFGLLGYAVVRALAGFIPYKPLQDAVARVGLDTFLTTWWGDVYVLLDDPVQAANIRGQVAKSIRALTAYGCRRIVIVAHSGGTIVTYMTLADPFLTEAADTLITHGQAIQMGRNIFQNEGSIPTSPGARIEPGASLRVTRWRDFHATHDPAPAGRLAEASAAPSGVRFADTEVWNEMSIANDHGGYFTNDEEFVDGVLSEIETAGRPDAPSRFSKDRERRLLLRRQRVFVLALWKRLMFVIPIVAIMTAFLTPSQGLIPGLRDAARSVVTFIPGSSELFGALQSILRPPGNDFWVTASATLFAVLYGFGIIQAAMPIGRLAIWNGWRKVVFRALDTGVFLLGVGIAIVVRALLANDPRAGVTSLVDRFGDTPLRNAVIIIGAIFVLLFVAPLRNWLARLVGMYLLLTRLIVVAGALLILGIAAYGPIVDAGIRMVVGATVVAFGIFQILGKVGSWRWARWDDAERAAARERSTVSFPRRWIWVEFLALGAIATLAALAIALGNLELLRQAAMGSAAVIVVLVIADVVLRKPVRRAVRGRSVEVASSGGAVETSA